MLSARSCTDCQPRCASHTCQPLAVQRRPRRWVGCCNRSNCVSCQMIWPSNKVKTPSFQVHSTADKTTATHASTENNTANTDNLSDGCQWQANVLLRPCMIQNQCNNAL